MQDQLADSVISIRSDFAQILITYLPSKVSPFKSHPLAQFLRHHAPSTILKEAAISSAYKIDGSAGKGNWAEVPWICIFDREITESAQSGYYIVYLFRADMKGVYLSLNQGWTQFGAHFKPVAEAKRKIGESAEMLRRTLHYQGFDTAPIDLASKNILGVGYELGHICGKYYDRDHLPNELVLIDDLRNLVGVYRELKDRLSGKPLIEELANYQYEKANLYVSEGEKPTKEEYDKVKDLAKDIDSPHQLDTLLQKFEKMMAGRKPVVRQRLASAIVRNPKIAELVKKRADYRCQVCNLPGFEKRDGGFYAEVHHIAELGGGGLDLPSNMICLCPLCHRKIHYGKG